MRALRPAIVSDGGCPPARSDDASLSTTAHGPTFVKVYEDHFPFVWRSARRLGTPDADVDDVVQEIFVIAHRRLPEFQERSSVRTWLFGIVLNVVRAHRRKLRARHPHALIAGPLADAAALADVTDGPHELAARSQATRLVERFLEALDDDKREVFVLVEFEQMSAPEIADVLKIPLNTVYSRLRLAREEFGAAAARHRAREDAEVRLRADWRIR